MCKQSGFMSLVLFISLLIVVVNAKCNYNGLTLQPGYDISIAPSSLENQFVQTKLKFLNIYKIDDGHATMTLILNIYLTWNDSRISITGDRERLLRSRQFQSDCIWSPTYQFKGQISLKLDSIDKNDMSLRMTKMKDTTEIRNKEKVVLEINCPLFDFTDFPFDNQICSVILRSSHRDFKTIGSTDFGIFGKGHLQYKITYGNVSEGPESIYAFEKSGHGTTMYLKRKFFSYLR